jgi:hypothetical protein
MDRIKRARPSAPMVVAMVALVAALAGTAIGGVATTASLNKKDRAQVRKIARKQANIRITKRAPGLSVAKANTSNNANAVGGTPLSGLLRVNGCQGGKVLGFARVLGSASMPNGFTTSATFIDTVGNCSGQTTQVRRIGLGVYRVRWNGVNTLLAVATGGGQDATVSAVRIPGESSFEFRAVNPVTDALVDVTFTVMTF